ncbi:MAG TPA: hypothetical protein PLO62_12970 [Candidatus Hydrogenedentes bacterium]|nr:hypothetical protein [Candidatus Hydrogenedentota bacterium]
MNIRALPMLSPSEMSRLGLPKLTINMIGTPSESRPRASAMINFNIVYVGDEIQGTSAKLIGVDVKGIGIEIDGSRYFVSQR